MDRRTIAVLFHLLILTSILTTGLLTRNVWGSLVTPQVDATPSETVVDYEISIRALIQVGAG